MSDRAGNILSTTAIVLFFRALPLVLMEKQLVADISVNICNELKNWDALQFVHNCEFKNQQFTARFYSKILAIANL